MSPAYNSPNVRRNAAARAAKMMKLFNSPHFEDIMKEVDPVNATKTITANFSTACAAAGLNKDETAWLWSYLKECDAAVYGKTTVREAAGSGW